MIDDLDTILPFLRWCLDEDEHDPGGWPAERVTAEVAAKRRIIAAYETAQRDWMDAVQAMDPDATHRDVAAGRIIGLGDAIRALAYVYNDRLERYSNR